MILYVRGTSGRLYELTDGWINLIDGLGQRITGTCWWTPGWHMPGDSVVAGGSFPVEDQIWAMKLALEMDEERVWRDFPWRAPQGPQRAVL